jgi:hypothetical protein
MIKICFWIGVYFLINKIILKRRKKRIVERRSNNRQTESINF